MPLINRVKSWVLSTRPNFEEGVMLYREAYPQEVYLHLLFTKPAADANQYNITKLYHELKKYYLAHKHEVLTDVVDQKEESPQPKEQTKEPLPDVIDTTKVVVENEKKYTAQASGRKTQYPKQLHRFIDEQKRLYKERDFTFYRVQAGGIKRKKDLSHAAKFLLQTELRIKEIYEALDYYERHQAILPAFMEAGSETVQDYLAMERRVNTLRTYITKYRQALRESPENSRAAYQLQRYEEEQNDLLKKLGKL